MISVDEALQSLREHVPILEIQGHSVDQAWALKLAADVVSRRDIPAFDKSQMDGVALRSQDLNQPTDTVQIVGSVMAGEPFPAPLQPGQAVRIMTGGVVPEGCDCVVPREMADVSADNTLGVQAPPRPGDHLLRKGELIRVGDTVLPAGTRMGAAQLALLLEIGCQQVLARPRVRAAVLATGTELVDRLTDATEGHIANTNGPMLAAMLREFGCDVTSLGVVADDTTSLREKIEAGLEFDLLVTSGGVSAGDRDLTPKTLVAAGVRPWFHRVRMKPGKPLWFGTTESGTVVLGLPGNPVSSFVGFQLFVRTALSVLTDDHDLAPTWQHVPTVSPWQGKSRRETFWPARLRNASGFPQGAEPLGETAAGVELLPWKGSSDLRTLASATGMVRILMGTSTIDAGEFVPYSVCGKSQVAGLATVRNLSANR